MSNIEVTNSEKKKIYAADEKVYYGEKIIYLQLNRLYAFNNTYNLFNQLQREGYVVGEVMKEFISYYNLKKSQNPLRVINMDKALYYMLNDIKDNLCEGVSKEQLDKGIHTMPASLGGM